MKNTRDPMIETKILDKSLIKFTSISYYLAYKCLIQRHFEQSNYYGDKEIISVSTFPAITLCSFSCEIALKKMLYEERKIQIKTHDLEYLFFKLKKETQEYYLSETLRLMGIKKDYYKYENDIDFNVLLKENKLTFETTRYLYDSKGFSVDIDFLEAFMFALNDEMDSYLIFISTYKFD